MIESDAKKPVIVFGDHFGWVSWNYSIRVSAAINFAKDARTALERYRAGGGWSEEDLAALEAATGALEECSRRARDMWALFEKTRMEPDDGLASGGAKISSRVGEPSLERRRLLTQIFCDGRATECYGLFDEYKQIVARVSAEEGRG